MVLLTPKIGCFREAKTLREALDALCIQKKCMAWVAILEDGIIGSFLFEDDWGNTVTGTKEHYIPVLDQFWEKLKEHKDLDEENSGSSRMLLILTLLILPWHGFVKNWGGYLLYRGKEKILSEIEIGLVGRVFANGLGDLGSIPGHVIPKTFKMVLDTYLLNTQQYEVHIEGKVEQSRERSSTLPYTSV